MKKSAASLLFSSLLFSSLLFSASCELELLKSEGAVPFTGADVTAGIESLGNIKGAVPASVGSKIPTHAYARNIWDMQVFDGRIFLGYGCWSNTGPSGNAGPLPILALDIGTKNIVREEVYGSDGKPRLVGGVHVAEDEQLWRFKVLGGKLYAPGCDPRAGWELGDFYVRQDNGTWLKKRTIPGGIHVLDIAEFNGKLYAGIDGSVDIEGSFEVMYSEDDGDTWKAPSRNNPNLGLNRIYTLIPWQGTLYGFNETGQKYLSGYSIDKTNTAKFVNFETDLPETQLANKTVKAHAVVGDTLAFTLGLSTKTEGLDGSGGLYYSKTFPYNNKKAQFPEPRALPRDILGRSSYAYVLANVEHSANNFTVIVYKTANFTVFEECFRFNYDTFARSFEEHSEEFYFGMGTEDGTVPSELSGDIIKVPYDLCH